METALGADFGAVRVHTGTEAHQLNQAVSAIAFTTGPDIFFRDEAYNPSSSEGKELLAHELTHVVQQGGAPGNAQRVQVQRMCPACEEEKKDERLQYKLTVSQPDDQYEQEADQMARAVVTALETASLPAGPVDTGVAEPVQRLCACGGAASSEGKCEECKKNAEGVQRQSISHSVAGSVPSGMLRASPNIVQREVTQPLRQGSITLDATGELFEGAKRLDTVKFGKGVQEVAFSGGLQQKDPNATFHGTIRLNLSARWKFTADFPGNLSIGESTPGEREGQGLLVVDAPFRIPKSKAGGSNDDDTTAGGSKDDDDTAVKIKQPRLVQQFSSGTGAALDTQPQATADADDNGLSVTASPRVTYQEQQAIQAQLGIDLSKLPLVGGLAELLKLLGATGQLATQNQAANTQAFGTSFTVNLAVTKFQPPSDKEYHCARTGDPANPQGGFGPFIVASDHFIKEDDVRQKIHDWYFGLEAPVRRNLEEGKGILRVTGRASTTGSKTFNLDLAEKRAKRVRGIIADFAGSNAHLNSFALGEFGAQTPDNKEVAGERRVDVQVDGKVPGKQVKDLKGDGCSGGSGTTPTGPTGPVNPPEKAPEGGGTDTSSGSAAAGPVPSGGAVASAGTPSAAPGAGGPSAGQSVPQSFAGGPSGPENITEESPAPAGGPTQAPEEAPSASAAAGGEAAATEAEPEEVNAA
jgi:hypothetical protein